MSDSLVFPTGAPVDIQLPPQRQFLVADDNKDVREWIVEIVEKMFPDVSVFAAAHTIDAIHHIRGNPGLVGGTIDYQIPNVNGPGIIREWRKIEAERGSARARIALVTSYGEKKFEKCKAEAMQAGADEAITTHYTSETYIQEIRDFVARVLGATPNI